MTDELIKSDRRTGMINNLYRMTKSLCIKFYEAALLLADIRVSYVVMRDRLTSDIVLFVIKLWGPYGF